MKISGFTFIRNGLLLDYPFLESIRSLLPLCDEVIVVAGNSTDDTRQSIHEIGDAKIKIVDTIWDENMRDGGRILAYQTNIALQHITGDWGIYLQGDEVIHEKDYETIKAAINQHHSNPDVEGLLFKYLHFFGSYKYIGDGANWYRREIRIIRNIPGIQSYKDAQGFRRYNKKLKVKLIDADIFHYGYVRNPRAQQLKIESFNKLWHDDDWIKKNVVQASEADYSMIESLSVYQGTHPTLMQNRIKGMYWTYNYDPSRKKFKFKNWFKKSVFHLTGYLPGEYRNYTLI